MRESTAIMGLTAFVLLCTACGGGGEGPSDAQAGVDGATPAGDLCALREAAGCPVGGDYDVSCESFYRTSGDRAARLGCAQDYQDYQDCRVAAADVCDPVECEPIANDLNHCAQRNDGGETCMRACSADAEAGCPPSLRGETFAGCDWYCTVGEVNWEYDGCGDEWRGWQDCRAGATACDETACTTERGSFEACRDAFCADHSGYSNEHVSCD